jgi:hypothetical protein
VIGGREQSGGAAPPTPGAAPPTVPGVLGAGSVSRVRWPNTLGIVLVCFGVLGSIHGAWNALAPRVMAEVTPTYTPAGTSGVNPMSVMRDWSVGLTISGLVLAAVSLVLIAGAVGLMLRKAWARAAILAWVPLKVGGGILTGVVSGLMQEEMMRAVSQGTGMPGGLNHIMLWGTAALTTLWYAILPGFALFWFFRPAVRRDLRIWTQTPRGREALR